jgi:hypothetical protein
MAAEDGGTPTGADRASGAVTCSWCGATAAAMPLTWTTSTERDGRLRRYCEACAREHLRSIEGRLDSEWW